jgi:hypothetical protein
VPPPVTAAPAQHKTLPHALGRAATTATTTLQAAPQGTEDRLARGLAAYASAWDRVAEARVAQDGAIQAQFLAPWRNTLSNSIDVAMKARTAVRTSRLELDAAKQMYVTPAHATRSSHPCAASRRHRLPSRRARASRLRTPRTTLCRRPRLRSRS